MNIADYLRELLVQNNEVSVPGLGLFSLKRKNAYYSESEAKFYPPYHQVKFCAQPKDDDSVFVEFLAERKNILLSTANYLLEKYVSDLTMQATEEQAALADMGWFFKENSQLLFTPNDKLSIDPEFYGYAPISLDKVRTKLLPKHIPATPLYFPAVIPNQSLKKEEYFAEKEKRKINTWLVLFVGFVFAVIFVLGIFTLFPSTYSMITGNKTKDTVVLNFRHKKPVKNAISYKSDTLVDSNKKVHFAIIDMKVRLPVYGLEEVRKLEARGIKASIILPEGSGNLTKVAIGSYKDFTTADSAKKALINAGKINKNSDIIPITTQ